MLLCPNKACKIRFINLICRVIIQSINQSINQSTDRSIYRLVVRSEDQLIKINKNKLMYKYIYHDKYTSLS